MSYPRAASPSTQLRPTNRSTTRSASQLPVRSRKEIAAHNVIVGQSAATQPAPVRPSRMPLKAPEAETVSRYRGWLSQKRVWVGGVGAIALALLSFIPGQVGSKAVDPTTCQKKIRPTGAISRGQISALLALPTGASKEAVRRVVDEPYCLLSAIAKDPNAVGKGAIAGAEREAYPLAFDPEAWVVVTYEEGGKYVGYDFVFKP